MSSMLFIEKLLFLLSDCQNFIYTHLRKDLSWCIVLTARCRTSSDALFIWSVLIWLVEGLTILRWGFHLKGCIGKHLFLLQNLLGGILQTETWLVSLSMLLIFRVLRRLRIIEKRWVFVYVVAWTIKCSTRQRLYNYFVFTKVYIAILRISPPWFILWSRIPKAIRHQTLYP